MKIWLDWPFCLGNQHPSNLQELATRILPNEMNATFPLPALLPASSPVQLCILMNIHQVKKMNLHDEDAAGDWDVVVMDIGSFAFHVLCLVL